MDSIKKLIALVLLASVAFSASAKVEEIFVLEDVPFSGLKSSLQFDGNGKFETMAIANEFATFIKTTYPVSSGKEEMAKGWMEYYGLPAKMSEADYTNGHKKWGVVNYAHSLLAKQTKAGAAPLPTVKTQVEEPVKVAQVQAAQKTTAVMTDSAIALAIANLEGQVSKLEARGDINVKALKAEISKAAAAQAIAVTRADYQKLTNHLAALEQGVSERIAKLEVAVGQLKTSQKEATQKIATLEGATQKMAKTLTGHDDSIKELEGKVGGGMLGIWGLVSGLLALCGVVLLVLYRRVDVKAVERLNQAHNKVATETSQLRLATGHRMVSFDKKFEAVLEEKAEAIWLFKVSDDSTVYAVTLSPASEEGLWYIHGILNQTNAVKTENIKGVIARAARLDSEGNHRLTPM
jgi:hypothetical protein